MTDEQFSTIRTQLRQIHWSIWIFFFVQYIQIIGLAILIVNHRS